MSGRRERLAGVWWRTSWRFRERWHRYSVEGVEHLLEPGAALLVGYHGRPVAHDLCMLQIRLEERHGITAHPIMHAAAAQTPVLRHAVKAMGMVTGDGPELAAAVAQGHKLMVTPGGTHEGCRPWTQRYRVDWGGRTGYVKLALKYRLPLVPAAGIGVDDTYVGLNDGDDWARRLGAPAGLPVWLGVGPFGLWPLSPPFPVTIRTRVGAPMRAHLDRPVDPKDKAALAAVDAEVRAAVQALLDEGRRA